MTGVSTNSFCQAPMSKPIPNPMPDWIKGYSYTSYMMTITIFPTGCGLKCTSTRMQFVCHNISIPQSCGQASQAWFLRVGRETLEPRIAWASKIKFIWFSGFLAESWSGTSSIGFGSRRRRVCRCFCVCSVLGGQFRARTKISFETCPSNGGLTCFSNNKYKAHGIKPHSDQTHLSANITNMGESARILLSAQGRSEWM